MKFFECCKIILSQTWESATNHAKSLKFFSLVSKAIIWIYWQVGATWKYFNFTCQWEDSLTGSLGIWNLEKRLRNNFLATSLANPQLMSVENPQKCEAAKFVRIDLSTAKQILIGCGISFERRHFSFSSRLLLSPRKISLDAWTWKRNRSENQQTHDDRLEIEIVKCAPLSQKTVGSKFIQFSRHFVFNYRLKEPWSF